MTQSNVIGAAGEHYVLSRLLLQNRLGSLAPNNVRDVDILVLDLHGLATAFVQVKTTTVARANVEWQMSAKHESLVRPDLLYAFVDLSKNGPRTFLVPSEKVAAVLRESHRAWLRAPGKAGQPHNDNDKRRIRWAYDGEYDGGPDIVPGWLGEYEDAWHLLPTQPKQLG